MWNTFVHNHTLNSILYYVRNIVRNLMKSASLIWLTVSWRYRNVRNVWNVVARWIKKTRKPDDKLKSYQITPLYMERRSKLDDEDDD